MYRSTLLAALLAMGSGAVAAAATGGGAEAQSELLRQIRLDVQADGMLYGFGSTCQMPEKELFNLFSLHANAAKAAVKKGRLDYTSDDFTSDYTIGVRDSHNWTSRADAQSLARNCAEIKAKVLLKIGAAGPR